MDTVNVYTGQEETRRGLTLGVDITPSVFATCLSVLGPVSWRPTTVKWRQFSQSNRHSTIGTPQTEYHEALPSSANVQWHLTSSFTDDGNASWYSVCWVPMVEWRRRLDCENYRHLTVVGLHDTGPWRARCLCLLVDLRPSNLLVCRREGSAQISVRADTLG